MKSTLILLLCLAAAGCSTGGQIPPDTLRKATMPLTCTNKTQCDAWWQRAQVWVSSHTHYRLQTVTDSVIQTEGPDSGNRSLAYQITKTPSNNGDATIGFSAQCENMLGCEPNPWEAGADFKQFVRNGPHYEAPAPTVRPMPPSGAIGPTGNGTTGSDAGQAASPGYAVPAEGPAAMPLDITPEPPPLPR